MLRSKTLRVAIIFLAAIVFQPASAQTTRSIDYQAVADGTDWGWNDQRTTPLACMGGDKYTFRLTSEPSDQSAITISISEGGKELYSWKGHRHSVWVIGNDRLYYAVFNPISPGTEIIAVDLPSGRVIWKSRPRGVPRPVFTSAYGNELNLDLNNNEVLTIVGAETAGRYIEFKDLNTGETVGHRVFHEGR